jgi:hypothetical protein
VTVAGFLAVVAQVLDHDDPAPGLSRPGLLTIALAAAVVALLTIHRRNGPRPLARALAEYTVVALLATLLAAPGVGLDQQRPDHTKPTKADAAAGEDQPTVLRTSAAVIRSVTGAARALGNAVRWLADLWRQANQKAKPPNSEAMAASPPSPAPPALSTWRNP